MDELDTPEKSLAAWRRVEASIRDGLSKLEASEAMEVEITARMREHFEQLNSLFLAGTQATRITLPPLRLSPAEAEAISIAVREGTGKVLGRVVGLALNELLDLEIRLYQSEHETDW